MHSRSFSLRAGLSRGILRKPGGALVRSWALAGSSRLLCKAFSEAEKWDHLAAHRAQRKRKFRAFRNRRPRTQHVEIAALDRPQNLQTAAAEQIKIDRQLATHHTDQRQTPRE